MHAFLWLAAHLGLVSAAAFLPRAQHLSPFQLDGAARRNGPAQPVNIDLSAWHPGKPDQQWAGEVLIGSPPQKFNLIFDTGSTAVLVASKNCSNCFNNHTLFDPSKSTTFSTLPGYKDDPQFGSTETSPHNIANCTIVTDEIGVAGRQVPSEFLLCDAWTSGFIDQGPDGLFGLSLKPNSSWGISIDFQPSFETVYWHLVATGQLPGPEFSFSLLPSRGPHGPRDGVLTFGGTDPSQYLPGTLKKAALDVPLSNAGNRFVLDVLATRVGTAPATWTNATNAVALIDKGTSTMVTPDRNTTVALYAAMSPQIVTIDAAAAAWGAPCAVLDRHLKDVTFTVGSVQQKVDVVFRKKWMNLGEYPGQPGICQAVFVDPGYLAREPLQGRPAWIFGSPWLRSYYTVWNAVELTMGFATPSSPDC